MLKFIYGHELRYYKQYKNVCMRLPYIIHTVVKISTYYVSSRSLSCVAWYEPESSWESKEEKWHLSLFLLFLEHNYE